MSKHTPAPWVLRTDQNFNIGTYDGYAIADPSFEYSSLPREELEANARLIAAAPDLLAALRNLMAAWPEGMACEEKASSAFDDAYDAIFAATGEKS